MRTRQKRTLVKGEPERQKVINEVKNIIQTTGMKYAIIPNGIFDELYIKEETKFTELDMITYVFLQFMMINKFTLTHKDFAEYIGCSSKQLKIVLNRLQQFKAKTNAVYYPYEDKVKIVDEKEVPLISEKMHSAYNPKTKKNKKTLHWYTNFIPYYKSTKKKDQEVLLPENFFMVTLEDFELLINGVLTRTEFVTYLFFLRAYKFGANDDKQVYWKLSTITEMLNYRLVETVHKHVEKILNLSINSIPLLEEIRPKNYDMQIMKGEEPSSKYIPRYNTSKMVEMSFGKMEVGSVNEEVNSEKVEVSF